jgi:hypothetical protein
MSSVGGASSMAMSSWRKSSAATTSAHAALDAGFKACCMKSGAYDGSNRNHYFQAVIGADAAYRSVNSSIRGGAMP